MKGTAALSVTAFLLGACGHPASSGTTRYTANGVEVTVAVSATTALATYRPMRPGFHLYSIDLPRDGIQGLGIPTRLEARKGLAATGPLRADKAVHLLQLPGLNVRLPVYPNGPVTVSLPVKRTSGPTEVIISYAACSVSTCLAPVIGKVLPVALD